MTNKVEFTTAELKAEFPDYGVTYSDDQSPGRAALTLPKALQATIDLHHGLLLVCVEASWDCDARVEFSRSDEADAQHAIEASLLPDWKSEGFEPTGEHGFQDESHGDEPLYSVTLQRHVKTMADVKEAIRWIVDEAETSVRV